MKTNAFRFFPSKLQILLPAALFLAAQGTSLAQSTWTGATNTAWTNIGNWSPAAVPGLNASVIVDKNSAAAYTIAIGSSPTLTNWSSNITGGGTTGIRASGNQTLTINGTLTKTGESSLTFRSQTVEKLTMEVGILNHTDSVGSTVTFGTTGNELSSLNITTANVSSASGSNQLVFLGGNNTADYTIETLNVGTGGLAVIANGVGDGEQRAINVGSLNGAGGIRGSNSASTGVATLNLTGTSNGSHSGAIVNGSAIARVVKSGSATQTLSNAGSTYTGGTLINAGTLVVGANNAIGAASGAVEISGSNQATLRFNSGVTVGNNITFSSTNATSSIETEVASGAAFRTGTTGNLTSNFASATPNTTASILGGNATAVRTLSMSFSGTSAATNDGTRKSDVFSLSGSSTDRFVLQLSTTGLVGTDFVGWLNGSTWVNAVSGNTGNNASLAQQGYLGSFSAFQTTYGSTLSNYVGAYGVDATAGSAWAVLNHNSGFAVVPEPSTWALLAGSLTFMMVMRRRRRG